MATIKYVELDLPEATTLADLTGIAFDLETTRDFAIKLKDVLGEERPDFTLIDALMAAVLVRYSRAFTTGRRTSLKDDALAAAYDARQISKHRVFRALRNRYIAHSDSGLEETRPRAHYSEARVAEEGFTSITCQHGRLVGLSREDVDSIIGLSERMLDHIRACIDEERKKVLEAVRTRPVEAILSKGSGLT